MITNCYVKDSGKWPLPVLHFFPQYLPTGTEGNHEIICQDSQPSENILNWDTRFLLYKYFFLRFYGNWKLRGLVSKLAPHNPIRNQSNQYFFFVFWKICWKESTYNITSIINQQLHLHNYYKLKLSGLSPHANYTDRAASAGRRI